MHPTLFLSVTGFVELGTGLLLLLLPAIPLDVLLGVSQPMAETLFIGRIAGAALLALGVVSWLGRCGDGSHAVRGLLVGLLTYDCLVAALLVYAALGLNLVGIALWPAVVIHTSMAGWCAFCLRNKP